jgi:hypothetical protein
MDVPCRPVGRRPGAEAREKLSPLPASEQGEDQGMPGLQRAENAASRAAASRSCPAGGRLSVVCLQEEGGAVSCSRRHFQPM